MANGKPYEILTAEAFQALLDQSPIRGVKVQQDVTLPGKDSPSHQIDVYWEFDIAGIPHQDVIQSKNWKNRVRQGELLLFSRVLEDIPGQPRGIVVARRGFQRGAREFAKKNRIELYQLEPVTHEGPTDLTCTTLGYARFEVKKTPLFVLGAGRVGYSYISKSTTFEPEFKGSRFDADLEWMAGRYGLSRDEAEQRARSIRVIAPPHEIKLYDESEAVTSTIARVYRGFVDQAMKKEGRLHKLTHRFDTPTFMQTGDAEIPLLKIDTIHSTVTVKKTKCIERAWRLPNMALCVLRNLSTGTVQLVAKKVTANTEAVAAPGSAA